MQKLYLVLGAEPLMACAFCSSDAEYKAYAAFQVLAIYLAHAWIVVLLTMPAYGTLSAVIDYVLLRGKVAPPEELRPVRTRAHMRFVALAALVVLCAADVARIFWATYVPVQGLWQHVRVECLPSGMRMHTCCDICACCSYSPWYGCVRACRYLPSRSCRHSKPCRPLPAMSRPGMALGAAAPTRARHAPTPKPIAATCHSACTTIVRASTTRHADQL